MALMRYAHQHSLVAGEDEPFPQPLALKQPPALGQLPMLWQPPKEIQVLRMPRSSSGRRVGCQLPPAVALSDSPPKGHYLRADPVA